MSSYRYPRTVLIVYNSFLENHLSFDAHISYRVYLPTGRLRKDPAGFPARPPLKLPLCPPLLPPSLVLQIVNSKALGAVPSPVKGVLLCFSQKTGLHWWVYLWWLILLLTYQYTLDVLCQYT